MGLKILVSDHRLASLWSHCSQRRIMTICMISLVILVMPKYSKPTTLKPYALVQAEMPHCDASQNVHPHRVNPMIPTYFEIGGDAAPNHVLNPKS